jgi:hypothetical protein
LETSGAVRSISTVLGALLASVAGVELLGATPVALSAAKACGEARQTAAPKKTYEGAESLRKIDNMKTRTRSEECWEFVSSVEVNSCFDYAIKPRRPLKLLPL